MKDYLILRILVIALFIFTAFGCSGPAPEISKEIDPLPSWNQGDAKQRIVAFVESVTDPASVPFASREVSPSW